jgi:hypothetical protein
VLAGPAPASAADCGCNHEITPGTTSVNGTDLGVKPGDVVCVMAGDYEFIRFREIHGTAEAPVVVKNCGGVVNVRNLDRWHEYLTSKGVVCLSKPERSPRGHSFFFAKDFDGNLIEMMDLGYMHYVLQWGGPLGGWLVRRGMYKRYYS